MREPGFSGGGEGEGVGGGDGAVVEDPLARAYLPECVAVVEDLRQEQDGGEEDGEGGGLGGPCVEAGGGGLVAGGEGDRGHGGGFTPPILEECLHYAGTVSMISGSQATSSVSKERMASIRPS